MKTKKIGRRQAIALLSLILIFVLICSAPDIQTNLKRTEKQPVKAGSNESRLGFMLPISLPESQVFNGAQIAKAEFVPIQSGNKLTFAVLGSLLSFSCLELWKHRKFRVIQYIHRLKPEMSLRMGGHAPPAAICD